MTKVFGTFSVTKHSPTYFTFNDTSNPGWHHHLDITEAKFNKLSDISSSIITPGNIFFYFGHDYDLYRIKPAGGLEFVYPKKVGLPPLDMGIFIDDPFPPQKLHSHTWKEYVGFTHRYYYCDCNEKRDTLP